MIRIFLLLLICGSLAGCETDPPGSETNNAPWLLTSVITSTDHSDLNFEYDENNRLIKFYKPDRPGAPCYVYYSGDKISHIIAEYTDMNGLVEKSSMIFQYAPGGSWVKVYYKGRYGIFPTPPNSHPYFTDLADGRVDYRYDSIAYSNGNRVEGIFNKSNSPVPDLSGQVKFYYSNASDTSLYKLETAMYNVDGSTALHNVITFTEITHIPNPARKHLWFFPFVVKLTSNSSSFSDIMRFPVFVDDNGVYMEGYATMIPRMVRKYEEESYISSYHYESSLMLYTYQADSTELASYTDALPFPLTTGYRFKKGR